MPAPEGHRDSLERPITFYHFNFSSPEWRNFNHEDIYNFGLMNESDFDFWISVEDLVEFFDNVYIAHQSSDTMAGMVSDSETQERF